MRTLIVFFTLFFTLQSGAQLADGLYANLHTNQGDVIVQLEFEKTPLTVINFVGLAEGTKESNIQTGKPFYNGLIFHRVIDNFMIQGGDPKGNGTGGPGYKFADEITDLKHDDAGILSMANSGPNTNGSQFFITHIATPWLDGKHTVFGHVIKGMSVVNGIKKDDFIRKVEIIRVGNKAKKFKTDEIQFKVWQKKYASVETQEQTEKKAVFANFVKTNYPNAKVATDGHYVQIDKAGSAIKPKIGDKVNAKLVIDLADGTNIRKADEALTFAAGKGVIIKIIDQSVLTMGVGEKRTLIASYAQIYGNSKRGNLSQDAIIIFRLELLSINKAK